MTRTSPFFGPETAQAYLAKVAAEDREHDRRWLAVRDRTALALGLIVYTWIHVTASKP